MITIPRPMNAGEILDRTFQIYRSRFVAFVCVAAFPLTARMALYLLKMIVDVFIGQTTLALDTKQELTAGVEWFTSRFAGAFIHYCMWSIFAVLVAQIVISDRLNIRSAFHECLARWRSWAVLGVALWLIESELPRRLRTSRFLWNAWGAMPYWLSTILTMLEGFALIAPLCLSVPAWSLERLGVRDAIARSWTLSKRSYGRMLLAWVLTDVMSWSIALMVWGLLFLACRLIFGNEWNPYSHEYARSVLLLPAYFASILTAPLFPIAITLIYYDQRIRLEGFDVEWMMLQAGYAAGMDASIPANTPEEIPDAAVGETQG